MRIRAFRVALGFAIAGAFAGGTVPFAMAAAPAASSPAAQPSLVAIRPAPVPGCPSAVEVEAALLARVPGVVVPFERAVERRALVLALTPLPAGAGAELTLVAVDGAVRLRRQLLRDGAERKRPDQTDCNALADTAVLIVERYLAELDQPPVELSQLLAPPPAPPPPVVVAPPVGPPAPPPVWTVALGGHGIGPSFDAGAFAATARVARTLGSRRIAFLYARGGLSLRYDPIAEASQASYRGRADAQRFPAELGLGARWAGAGRWEGQFAAGLAADVTHVRAVDEREQRLSQLLLGPQAGIEVAAQLLLTRRVFARLSLAGVAQLLRYEFYRDGGTQPDGRAPVFTLPTQRIRAKLSFELGFVL